MFQNPYNQSIDKIFQNFNTSRKGLAEDQLANLRNRYGFNQISKSNSESLTKMVLSQFTSPLVIILILAVIVSLFLKEPKDAVVILVIIIVNAIIGFFQELQAQRSINSLRTMIEENVGVIRDGQQLQLNSSELLPGDLVHLTAGDKVPADIRLVEVKDAQFDESVLTGESVPVTKVTHTIAGDNLAYTDQLNIAFGGTLLVRGVAKGIVVAIGDNSTIGQISQTLDHVVEDDLPLQVKINRFAQKIGIITMTGSLAVLVLGLILGISFSQIIRDMVAVLVAAVPEGLPIVVTITLAIGVQRMARSKAVIRHLPAVETLGSTTVIGTDKTGTLTKNQMTVTQIYSQHQVYNLSGEGYETTGKLTHLGQKVDIKPETQLFWTLAIGALCNDSRIETLGKKVKVIGDPTEGALHISALKSGLNLSKQLKDFVLVDEIPFDSTRYYMASLYEYQDKGHILVKGSPEVLLEMCQKVDKKAVLAQTEEFSRQGLRVLAMVKKTIKPKNTLHETDVKTGFEFCGLQAMIDPPRKEVIETIKECQGAGIRVVMITGDHAITATSIGLQVGIIKSEEQVITGKELQKFSDKDLDVITESVNIYARVSPEDKLRIVESLKRNDEIVAVTGDGVNDAPALKAAHIGVAMGRTGTDVARESADMVIMDDNFKSILKAVEQGRIVFENIRRVALFLVPTGIAAIITVLVSMLLGLPIPYTPIQLLWINLVTSGLQDVALAFEPGDGDSLKRKPIKLSAGIMTRDMLRRTLLVGGVISLGVIGLYSQALRSGLSLAEARSLAMTVTVLFQFFQVWNARSETKSIFAMSFISNPFLFVASLIALLAQLAVLYIGSLQGVFDTFGLNLSEWIMLLLISSSVILVVEIEKALVRNWGELFPKNLKQ